LGENMPKDQEEIIKAFNDIVQMTQEWLGKDGLATTLNFKSEVINRQPSKSLHLYQTILDSKLIVGATHQNKVLYGRIVTMTPQMKAALVLIDDHSQVRLLIWLSMGWMKSNPWRRDVILRSSNRSSRSDRMVRMAYALTILMIPCLMQFSKTVERMKMVPAITRKRQVPKNT
jgi:hypothetical protein